MKQDTLKRLFKSIDGSTNEDIVKVASRIIEEEEALGHKQLAKTLRDILEKRTNFNKTLQNELRNIFANEIPVSQRYNIPLAVNVERENLRHDMVLPPSIEERFQRIEKEFVAKERLALSGLKPRHKILLYGPPGCGKSMGAERIAWNIGLPFLKVRFEAIISSYLGESSNNLKKMFDSIKLYPSVLLLDEFDFLAKSRESSNEVGEIHRLVNILLYLLEEYNAPGILVATTNLNISLDRAVFRRFDDVIEIPKPGKEEISKMLREKLMAHKIEKSLKISEISEKLNGFSYAQIEKVVSDAAKAAIITGEGFITKIQIEKSIEEIQN